MERIIVYDLFGSLAITDADGEILYARIEKALLKCDKVIVDFSGVDIVLTHFLDAAIATLYVNHDSKELQEKVVITGLKSTDILRKVIIEAKLFYG